MKNVYIATCRGDGAAKIGEGSAGACKTSAARGYRRVDTDGGRMINVYIATRRGDGAGIGEYRA